MTVGTAQVTVQELVKALDAVTAISNLGKELLNDNPPYAMICYLAAKDITALLEKIAAASKAAAVINKAAAHD